MHQAGARLCSSSHASTCSGAELGFWRGPGVGGLILIVGHAAPLTRVHGMRRVCGLTLNSKGGAKKNVRTAEERC